MQHQTTPTMKVDDDNVDDSVNTNDIDAGNDDRNEDNSEGDVVGDTYDVDAAETNYVAIYYAPYTTDADNAYVGYNTNNDEANEPDNADAEYDTKEGNNIGMGEVIMSLMMLTLIMLVLVLMKIVTLTIHTLITTLLCCLL